VNDSKATLIERQWKLLTILILNFCCRTITPQRVPLKQKKQQEELQTDYLFIHKDYKFKGRSIVNQQKKKIVTSFV
jgi:outer membrane biogenesis lipoprotein LolB